jgi:hypothetical protein
VGTGFLDAYEQSMRTFADFQVRAAEGSTSSGSHRSPAPRADFTREVTKYATEAGRRLMK